MSSKKRKTAATAILPVPKNVEAGAIARAGVDIAQVDEKPSFETTTLWDYPKQSYGKTPKGNNLEKLIAHIIKDEVASLGLSTVDGNKLERTNSQNLPKELSMVKRNFLVDYGEFGSYLPDLDIIIYEPESCKVIAGISSKVTLRERIAQTGYWKLKLSNDEATKHIKIFFITPDEDGTLTVKTPAKKGRVIVEIDTDSGYVMTEADVEESPRVKMFDKFIDDLRRLAGVK